MMNYNVITTTKFDNEFLKLDKSVQKLILKYLLKISNSGSPKAYAKSLSGNLSGLYRYRVGNYRIIAEIKDKELIIYALSVGHRSTIYKKNF